MQAVDRSMDALSASMNLDRGQGGRGTPLMLLGFRSLSASSPVVRSEPRPTMMVAPSRRRRNTPSPKTTSSVFSRRCCDRRALISRPNAWVECAQRPPRHAHWRLLGLLRPGVPRALDGAVRFEASSVVAICYVQMIITCACVRTWFPYPPSCPLIHITTT